MRRIVLIGDTVLADPELHVDDALAARLRAADAVVANGEAPISDAPFVKSHGHPMATGPHTVGLLQRLGVTVALLANNHVMDHGEQGLRDTIAALEGAGIATAGAGTDLEAVARPLILGDGPTV